MSRLPDLDGYAGAAFFLSTPPDENLEFAHPEGKVLLRQGAAHVTVCLNASGSGSVVETKTTAWRIVQESLDVLAATGRIVLSTSKGDTEYSIWRRLGNDGYELTCVQTTDSQWSLEAHGKVGGIPMQVPVTPYTHHNSLRYYRMSKCSSDLFDAYRNAYLGLECLVSDVSRRIKKGTERESELDWLKRVVNGPLSAGVPGGIDAGRLLDSIYRDGRNPLFHAKTGETFYPPHGEQREEIQELFEQLTLLLVSLIQQKFGTQAIRRWAMFSQSLQDDQAQIIYEFDELQFVCGSETISATPEIELINSPRRFGQLWAKVKVNRPTELDVFRQVKFLRQGADWLDLEFEEDIPLKNVHRVIFELNSVSRNKHAPKPVHSN